MKSIIVVNDESPQAKHAAKIALLIAQKVEANLLLANVNNIHVNIHREKALTTAGNKYPTNDWQSAGLMEDLKLAVQLDGGFTPNIDCLDNSKLTEDGLVKYINKNNVWMVVKGMQVFGGNELNRPLFNIQSVLNRVHCPALLVPEHAQLKKFERIAYMADLRYCRLSVVKYQAELAKPFNANALITHLPASGLPDLDQQYAWEIFNEQISSYIDYDKLFYNNIKERNLLKALDVIINGMNTDLLALVNHQYHFMGILGRYITQSLPPPIHIPVLVFPF